MPRCCKSCNVQYCLRIEHPDPTLRVLFDLTHKSLAMMDEAHSHRSCAQNAKGVGVFRTSGFHQSKNAFWYSSPPNELRCEVGIGTVLVLINLGWEYGRRLPCGEFGDKGQGLDSVTGDLGIKHAKVDRGSRGEMRRMLLVDSLRREQTEHYIAT